MNIEEIIINLKLLSQVEKGQKIITKDTYLNISDFDDFTKSYTFLL